MLTQEEIDRQQSLLTTHRSRLANYLQRLALVGAAHAPPEITNGIAETRADITRVKAILIENGRIVENLPDDAVSNAPYNVLPDNFKLSFKTSPHRNKFYIVIALICILVITYVVPKNTITPTFAIRLLNTMVSNESKNSHGLSNSGEYGFSGLQSWVVSFEYVIDNQWSLGEHNYSITLDCPQTYGSMTNFSTFIVSRDADLEPYTMYLRPNGVYDERLFGNRITVIHPNQKTNIMVSIKELTEIEAHRRSSECKAFATLDTTIPVNLDAQTSNTGGSGGGG